MNPEQNENTQPAPAAQPAAPMPTPPPSVDNLQPAPPVSPVAPLGPVPVQQPVTMLGQEKDNSWMAITALVLGIITVLTTWIPFVGFLTFFLAIAGLVFGILGRKTTKKTLAIVGIVLNSIAIAVAVVIVLFAFGAGFVAGLKTSQADKELTEQAKQIGGNEEKTSTTKGIKSMGDAYELAKKRTGYKNQGIIKLDISGNNVTKKATYSFTFIDKDSRFEKNGYGYFKHKKVSMDESGQEYVEDGESFAPSKDPLVYGNSGISGDKLEAILKKGEAELKAKGYALGNVYAIQFIDIDTAAPSTDEWDVYYVKAGQDETTAGYRKMEAYAVRLADTTGLEVKKAGSAYLSLEF